MNYFDTFDENGVFISSEDEQDVHYKGLWHKIIRIWIYDNEGNVWLKKSKETGKLDTINEVHLLSSESVTNCFDRAMFERLGIHLPATSKITLVGMKKMSINKKFSDNSEFKGNYFLCDYIADFDDKISDSVKLQRFEEIMKIQYQVIEDNNKLLLGKTFEALVDHFDNRMQMFALRSYREAPDEVDGYIYVKDSLEIGKYYNIEITDYKGYDLFGKIKSTN